MKKHTDRLIEVALRHLAAGVQELMCDVISSFSTRRTFRKSFEVTNCKICSAHCSAKLAKTSKYDIRRTRQLKRSWPNKKASGSKKFAFKRWHWPSPREQCQTSQRREIADLVNILHLTLGCDTMKTKHYLRLSNFKIKQCTRAYTLK